MHDEVNVAGGMSGGKFGSNSSNTSSSSSSGRQLSAWYGTDRYYEITFKVAQLDDHPDDAKSNNDHQLRCVCRRVQTSNPVPSSPNKSGSSMEDKTLTNSSWNIFLI